MGDRFETTKWSLVLAAKTASNPQCDQALGELCEIYWYPLYAFLRRRGMPADQALDSTQGFFVEILEKRPLGRVHPSAGKFRSFLLASLKNFLSHEREREQALKRGGGKKTLSLDVDDAEGRYKLEPQDDRTPEGIFERRWALTIFERANRALRREFERADKAHQYSVLARFLTDAGPRPAYKEIAANLETSEASVKMAVRRMRQRFGDLLREEIAQTVGSSEEVDDELRHLLDVIRAD